MAETPLIKCSPSRRRPLGPLEWVKLAGPKGPTLHGAYVHRDFFYKSYIEFVWSELPSSPPDSFSGTV